MWKTPCNDPATISVASLHVITSVCIFPPNTFPNRNNNHIQLSRYHYNLQIVGSQGLYTVLMWFTVQNVLRIHLSSEIYQLNWKSDLTHTMGKDEVFRCIQARMPCTNITVQYSLQNMRRESEYCVRWLSIYYKKLRFVDVGNLHIQAK
jgi:hypothetical protein